MTGTLYGVGVGPGDPELLTLKAHRLITSADVIAYPVLEHGDSFARGIVADFLPGNAVDLPITIPMSVARQPAQSAYDQGAGAIAAHLSEGRSVVVLCEGDPFFYGSFMYLHARLSDRFSCQVIPGITSVTAVAAAAGRPLAARTECLTILPGTMAQDDLLKRVLAADAVAIMKVGRHLSKIRAVLEQAGLTDHAVYVERATLPVERVLPLADAPDTAPYFSMILVAKGEDPWL